MTLKEKINDIWNSPSLQKVRDNMTTGLTVAGGFFLLVAATSGLYYGISAVDEGLQHKQEKNVIAKVINTGYIRLHNDSEVKYARITYNGDTTKVYDRIRVLKGEFFMNDDIPKLKVGNTYEFSLIGNDQIGFDIIDVK